MADDTEVDITPEMIEAGVNAIDPYDREFILPSESVTLIYTAMFKASPRQDSAAKADNRA